MYSGDWADLLTISMAILFYAGAMGLAGFVAARRAARRQPAVVRRRG
jgi:hypothetical protein